MRSENSTGTHSSDFCLVSVSQRSYMCFNGKKVVTKTAIIQAGSVLLLYAVAPDKIPKSSTQRRAFVVMRKFSFTCSRPFLPS